MEALGGILGALLVLGLVVWGVWKAGKTENVGQRTAYKTMRCPTCGAQANVRGNIWECGFCGDFGNFIRK